MRAVWHGAGLSPSTSASSYAFIAGTIGVAFNLAPYQFNTTSPLCPLSDDVVVTSITAWVPTAPGTGKSWTVALQTLAGQTTQTTGTSTTTAASAVISDTNTTATWNGAVLVPQSSIVNMIITPASTPASTAGIYWTITYHTAGNFYLMPMNDASDWPFAGAVTFWYPPLGGVAMQPVNATPNTGASIPCPTALTVTKIICFVSVQSMPGSITRAFSPYNATTSTNGSFSSTSTGSSTTLGNVGVGSLSFAQGDLMCVQATQNNGYPGQGSTTCMTVVPSVPGEVMNGYFATVSPVNNATSYDAPTGGGDNVGNWTATEATVGVRFPACVLRRLYVLTPTAPGGAASYTYTLRQNSASTPLSVAISAAATTGNDSADAVAIAAGDIMDVQAVPSGGPASPNGVRFGYVEVIPQPVNTYINQAVQAALR